MSTIVSFAEMAMLVGVAVVAELDDAAEERCGPEEAIQRWAADHQLDALALHATIACLSAQALAALTLREAA